MDVNKLREKLKAYIQDESSVNAFIQELDEESQEIAKRGMIVREAEEQEENIIEVEIDDLIVAELRVALKPEFDALNQTITEQQAAINELTTKLESIERSLQDVSKPIKEQVDEAVEKAPLSRSNTKLVVRPTSKELVNEKNQPVANDGVFDIAALREAKRSKKTISNLFGEGK